MQPKQYRAAMGGIASLSTKWADHRCGTDRAIVVDVRAHDALLGRAALAATDTLYVVLTAVPHNAHTYLRDTHTYNTTV